MTGHHFQPQSSLSSPIHAVKPSLSFKVVNYIVHCLLPKTIKPTLWTSRDFSQSVSNIGLYNLWQGGIFTNFSLAYIPVSQSHSLFLFIFIIYLYIFLWDFISNVFWQTRLTLREEVSLKKVLVFLCLFNSCRLIIKRAEEKKKKKNNPEHDLRGFLFTLFFSLLFNSQSRQKQKSDWEKLFFLLLLLLLFFQALWVHLYKYKKLKLARKSLHHCLSTE